MPKREITYKWGANSLLITLGNKVNSRIRALYVAEFIFTSGMATVFMMQSIPLQHHMFNLVACIGAALLYALAAWRFLGRLFFYEQLLVDNYHITIIRKTFLSRHIRRFDWRHIGPLHYEGKGKKTDHPLKGKSFDYLGFETHEHLVQILHHAGNLYFESAEGRIYFAPGVYSWEAEKMVQMLSLYCGSRLKLGPEWAEMLQEQEFDDAASGNSN